MCSIAGSVYDVFGYDHPVFVAANNGMKFTTWSMDNDLWVPANCAGLGGGWWYSACTPWAVTATLPRWLSIGDFAEYNMKEVRMMIKRQ